MAITERMAEQSPYKIITWMDKENTGAIGWIVIHNLINGVSGGGLFMQASASLQEVQDLAYTMSFKNSLQQPMIGGGKGGIRFDPKRPEAKAVLQRFLKDNAAVIQSEWCTGGDINTTTKEITELLAEVSELKSPFHCLANMLQHNFNTKINIDSFNDKLQYIENKYFTVDQAITGYSIFQIVAEQVKVKNAKPKIIVQGFGKVGRAFCFYAQKHYDIVAICEKDWTIHNENGIDIEQLLASVQIDQHVLDAYPSIYRYARESDEDFLIRGLSQVHADVFSPCAVRYCITEKVLNTLITKTFRFAETEQAYIIAGANDVFQCRTLIQQAFDHKITVMPEWLSNPGSAILFMEALQQQQTINPWNIHIKNQVASRVTSFANRAANIAQAHKLNIYEACCYLANSMLNTRQQTCNQVAC